MSGARSWFARYPGYCPACSERIEVGDRITLASDDGAWVCHDCATEGTRLDHARGKREEPVCATCWLVHPEGACDR